MLVYWDSLGINCHYKPAPRRHQMGAQHRPIGTQHYCKIHADQARTMQLCISYKIGPCMTEYDGTKFSRLKCQLQYLYPLNSLKYIPIVHQLQPIRIRVNYS